MRSRLKKGQAVKIQTDAVYQNTQEPLNGCTGCVHKDTGDDNNIIVNVLGIGFLPFAYSELIII